MRPSSRNRLTIAAATTLVVFSGISCIEDLINQNEDPVGDVPVTAEEVETYLRSNFTRIPLIADAFNRVVQTVGGNPQPGVAIVLTAAGGTGTVQMDMNSDGNSDATVDGGLTFSDPTQGLNGGASLAINSVASHGQRYLSDHQSGAVPAGSDLELLVGERDDHGNLGHGPHGGVCGQPAIPVGIHEHTHDTWRGYHRCRPDLRVQRGRWLADSCG